MRQFVALKYLQMKETKGDIEHSYALDLKETVLHISQVERGRKGYFCPGCRQGMIAKKGKVNIQHFAHDPGDTTHRGQCTYSDETYRHKLGKEILQRERRIKVPALKKYPDIGQDGAPFVIRDAWVVEAAWVAIEMPFYENSDGQIQWGKHPDWAQDRSRNLLIQPDVTFFNANDEPILLIELVATHKITDEKYLRIRNLGLDTVQVSLPKGPPSEIQDTFSKTARTKWVYNYERETAQYQFVPARSGQEILPSDEFEKGLIEFGQTYECKVFEVNEAIRRFTRYLESEQFRSAKGKLDSDIRQAKRNTKIAYEQWEQLQRRIEEEVSAEFAEEEASLDQLESELGIQEGIFREHKEGVKKAYFAETGRIGREKGEYRSGRREDISELESRLIELGGNGKTISDRISDLREEEVRYQRSIESEESYLESATADIVQKIGEVEAEISRIEVEEAGLPEEAARHETELRSQNSKNEERVATELRNAEDDLRAEFDGLREVSIGAIEKRDHQRASRVRGKIEELVKAGGLLESITFRQDRERKLREIRKAVDDGSYKEWVPAERPSSTFGRK